MNIDSEVLQRIAAKRAGTTEEEQPDGEVEVEAAEGEEEAAAEPEAEEAVEDEQEESVGEEEERGEEEAEERGDDFFVARYKTREEAERGYAEKDETIQRLYRERDELQRTRQEEPVVEDAPLDREEWLEWASGEITTRPPRQVFAEAVAHAGEEAGFLVIDAMYGTGEPTMMREATTLAADYRVALARAEEEARRAPQIEREQREAGAREAFEAREAMKNRHPDYEDVEEEMDAVLDKLDDDTRVILQEVASVGIPGKMFVLEHLYAAARSGVPERLVRAKVEASKKDAERSRARKISATVASANASPARTPLTEAEQEEIAIKNRIRKGAGLPLLNEYGEETAEDEGS